MSNDLIFVKQRKIHGRLVKKRDLIFIIIILAVTLHSDRFSFTIYCGFPSKTTKRMKNTLEFVCKYDVIKINIT